MAKKAKFTFLDALIIIVVIAAAAVVAMKLMPEQAATGEKTAAEFVVMLTGKEPEFINAIHEGDIVSISNKEKDTGVVVGVSQKPAESMQYNSIKGEYVMQTLEDKKDVFVTIKVDASVDDKLIKAGTTPIKVGLQMPVRGKGYASMGYVVKLDEK